MADFRFFPEAHPISALLWSLFVFSVLRRRLPGHFTEYLGKIIVIRDSHLPGNLANLLVGGKQQFFCIPDTDLTDVRCDSLSENISGNLIQPVPADSAFPAEFLDPDLILDMTVYILLDLLLKAHFLQRYYPGKIKIAGAGFQDLCGSGKFFPIDPSLPEKYFF